MNTLIQPAFGQKRFFEAQLNIDGHRMCGAAALVMAYRKCGSETDQSNVWANIAVRHQNGYRTDTHRMALDALRRGLAAVIIQSHQPWPFLQNCWRNNLAVIINHRLKTEDLEGHYSVLAGIDTSFVYLHDPLRGPSTAVDRETFLECWLPAGQGSEIAGNVALVIATPSEPNGIAAHCNHPFDDPTVCRHCNHPVETQPAIALGCWNPECTQRMWYRIFCPQCDLPFQYLDGTRGRNA